MNCHLRFTAAAAGWVCSLLLIASSTCHAGWNESCGCQKPSSCMNNCCAEPCMLMCCPECKTVKVKEHCWEVDCEYVCVPKVQCPSLLTLLGLKKASCLSCDGCGQSGCDGRCCNGTGCNQGPLCGKIKAVKKLRKVETEVEKQVVEWKVKACAMDYSKCCNGTAPASCCAPAW